jgi:hypothetical protein
VFSNARTRRDAHCVRPIAVQKSPACTACKITPAPQAANWPGNAAGSVGSMVGWAPAARVREFPIFASATQEKDGGACQSYIGSCPPDLDQKGILGTPLEGGPCSPIRCEAGTGSALRRWPDRTARIHHGVPTAPHQTTATMHNLVEGMHINIRLRAEYVYQETAEVAKENIERVPMHIDACYGLIATRKVDLTSRLEISFKS